MADQTTVVHYAWSAHGNGSERVLQICVSAVVASYGAEAVRPVSKKSERDDFNIAEDSNAVFFARKDFETLLLVQQLSSADGHILAHLDVSDLYLGKGGRQRDKPTLTTDLVAEDASFYFETRAGGMIFGFYNNKKKMGGLAAWWHYKPKTKTCESLTHGYPGASRSQTLTGGLRAVAVCVVNPALCLFVWCSWLHRGLLALPCLHVCKWVLPRWALLPRSTCLPTYSRSKLLALVGVCCQQTVSQPVCWQLAVWCQARKVGKVLTSQCIPMCGPRQDSWLLRRCGVMDLGG